VVGSPRTPAGSGCDDRLSPERLDRYAGSPARVIWAGHVGHGVENGVLNPDRDGVVLSYVGDGVVAPSANLGPARLVANLRHDGEPVALTHDGKRASTGRRKFVQSSARTPGSGSATRERREIALARRRRLLEKRSSGTCPGR